MKSIVNGAIKKTEFDSNLLNSYAEKNKNQNLCENFEKGQCPYGDKCVFGHPKPIPPLDKTSSTSEEKKT